jgi:hypothetical protein
LDDGWDGLFDDDYVAFDEDGWRNGFYNCYYITDVFYESIRLCKYLLKINNCKEEEQFEGFEDHIGSKAIVNKYKVPRTTLQAWQEKENIETKADPQTNETYYPEAWFKSKLQNYKPRKKK